MNENQNEYVDINAHDNYPDSEQKIEIPTMKVIPLKKICMTIGELPTAYLETMSYYEMLIWFIEYLKNNIIPTVNNNAEAIQEVQSVVLALQNYINDYKDSIDSDVEELEEYMNNYFENLDVQEEINNKLDDMLEDGVLEQIIEQFLQLTSLICFDNVADMKLSPNLANGSYAKTLGYYSKNSGGGATYKIRSITNDDIVDEASIIALQDNSLIAELIPYNSINPEQFGAYGDNIHDDKNALQKMFDYPLNNIVMNKTYYVSNSIIIKGNNYKINGTASIRSDSNNPVLILNITYSEINLAGTIEGATCIKFRATEADDTWIQYVTLRNMVLEATDKCIECERNSTKWINELHFEGIEFNGAYGFYFMGNYNNSGYRFINCSNETCSTAFIKAYNLHDFDIIGFRNVESWDKTLIDIENNCNYFNINTSDPICLEKIKFTRTVTVRGNVIANINEIGGSRIGSYARCFNGVFFLNPESTNGLRLNSTNDTYDYTTNTENLFRTCITLDYVEDGHNYTIKIPQGYNTTTEKLLTIRNNGASNTCSLIIGNTTHSVTFESSGTFEIINHNGVLYLSKLNTSAIS